QKVQLTDQDRDAIARVAIAEAANQGDSGLAGVVYTIINRRLSGQFGQTVTDVVNSPKQFEPVTKVGGDWKKLPSVTVSQ
ncbi:cell wall hydrolase, partial [Escherichia coli]|nr:cell wall hydrolase [Escherichia coli]